MKIIYNTENLIDLSEEVEIIKFLSAILSNEKFTSPIDEIWELVYENKITKASINEILTTHEIKNIAGIKGELIELTLTIIQSFIKFHSIDLSQNEVNFVRKLMRLFSIDEGDIYKFRKDRIAKILQTELEKIYFNIHYTKEPIYQVHFQEPINACRNIPQEIRDSVWRRDEGKCNSCGSQVKLEFDHIVPFSKGGSNTYRNIQLLCEKCNRKKSAKIG